MRIKLFSGLNITAIEDCVNTWISENEDGFKILEIDFKTSGQQVVVMIKYLENDN
ncbi:hypothetical protein SAMN05421847_2166 [Halpernia humi]|uniref:Uncharacterized protein n=1 Tax=Halpernia humi TaxID=493375 RepID=A0A1H5ZR12_9FLAO|nr:hypothetical protein [Halpernia humi]SEG38993.1 hypothetical protein SAMN05421847_2166 [Halpernia humi]